MGGPVWAPKWLWWAKGDFVGAVVIALVISGAEAITTIAGGRSPSLLSAVALFGCALSVLFLYTRLASVGTVQEAPMGKGKTYGAIYALVVILFVCGVSFWLGVVYQSSRLSIH